MPGGLGIPHASAPGIASIVSIDFRTVHLDDAPSDVGPVNVDSARTGTTMGDYLRCADLAHLPAEIIERFEAAHVVSLGAGAPPRQLEPDTGCSEILGQAVRPV